MQEFLFAWLFIHVSAACVMMTIEAIERRRIDPIGCLAWPWWFARYSKRMWDERTAQYDRLRER